MQNTLTKTPQDGGEEIRVKEGNTKNFREYKCGCVLKRVAINKLEIHRYCKQHTPNYDKKADKIIERKEKKRGVGFTKSGHRKMSKKKRKKGMGS